MATAELILDCRNGVGESPVWVTEESSLYWVDIPAKTLWRWRSTDGSATTWMLPEMAGCVAHVANNRWIAGLENSIAEFTLTPDDVVLTNTRVLAQHALPGMRFNDGRCDRQGRFLAGTMFMDMAAAKAVGMVYSASAGGNGRVLLEGFITPNGMAFSPDGRTMYLSDSHPDVQTIWAFDYDPETGIPDNRRVFVDMKPLPGRPDGAAVDADGCYWICGNDAGLLHRFTPDGKLDCSLAVPVKKPAMCAFGGENLDTLFVTSIRPGGVDEAGLADQPLAGGIFALRPGVRGIPEPKYAA